MTIWKFILDIDDHVTVLMPKGAKVLTVQMQHGKACVWAICNPKAEKEERRFCWFGTGFPSMSLLHLDYVGTVQFDNGALVFHLFEVV